MNVLAHGIDVVDLKAFEAMLEADDSDLLARCFTTLEVENAQDRASVSDHLAGCFAAKEAVLKAMGCGFDGTVSPLEIEISATKFGAPTVNLSGKAADLASDLGISSWLLSKSDAAGLTIASALGLR